MSNADDRARVAPELAALIDLLPELDFSQAIEVVRGPFAGRDGAPTPGSDGVDRQELFVPGPLGAPDVRVLLYTPSGDIERARPALLHLHGGGYVLGQPEANDASNRTLARDHGCVVVSVDYRLAPETRFPGALEDCYAVLAWMGEQAAELALDVARIAVGGESAGAGHAAALALHARDRGGPPICFQMLDAPMLDDRTCAAEPHPYGGRFVWSPDMNRFGWQALLGVEPGGPAVPENAAPARAQDLAGLPPTFIAVGALDLFLDEDLDYARRLARAGVPVELHVIPGAYHGFGLVPAVPQTLMLTRLKDEALRRAFAR
ncbi:alpha/beta hydrolase [soil metagenome]